MEATVRVTYELTVIRDNVTPDELREYIEEQLYRTNDIGFDYEAEEVDLEIEIDEE